MLGFEGLLGAFGGAVGVACDRREVVGGAGAEPRDGDRRGDHVREVAFGAFRELGGRHGDFDARARAGLRCRRHFPGGVPERVFGAAPPGAIVAVNSVLVGVVLATPDSSIFGGPSGSTENTVTRPRPASVATTSCV